MIKNKEEFIKRFLPETITDIDYTQINLDVTDLSLSDILRNLNKLYPKNSRGRMRIENGELALGVLCKSDSLYPYKGVFIIVCKKELDVEIVSSSYIVFSISETRINTEEGLEQLMDDILGYLVNQYADSMSNLPDFYRKFVYNESELYEDEEDYYTPDY